MTYFTLWPVCTVARRQHGFAILPIHQTPSLMNDGVYIYNHDFRWRGLDHWIGDKLGWVRSFKTDELRVIKLTVPDVLESAHGRLYVRPLPRALGCFIAVDGPVFSEKSSAYCILHWRWFSTLKKLNTVNN